MAKSNAEKQREYRERKKQEGVRDERTRNWTFIAYPESAPENWRENIDKEHVAWVESPLHDADVNADKTQKKAHWHILVMFDNKKSYEQIKVITDSCNATVPQRVASVKGLVRYMAHLDNPEKTQYAISDIVAHGGADIAALLKPTSGERYTYIAEMISYVNAHEVTEFADLLTFAVIEHKEDWFPLLCDSCAYVIGQHIKSRRHKNKVEE